MATAVKMSVAPRSSWRRSRTKRRILRSLLMILTYEVGVESWRTLDDEMVDGVMTPRPGISGKSGVEE